MRTKELCGSENPLSARDDRRARRGPRLRAERRGEVVWRTSERARDCDATPGSESRGQNGAVGARMGAAGRAVLRRMRVDGLRCETGVRSC